MDRSGNMRAIRSKDMRPELAVRSLVHRLGYRFRLHDEKLPGKPDMVFRSRQKVIFVHGCFWHSHGCKLSHSPRTNLAYWNRKLERNRDRDRRAVERLEHIGWRALVIWECEAKDEARTAERVREFLEDE